VSVLHEGISNTSRVFEGSIANTLVNHVYKRTFHGQSGDFFMSSINVVASTGKMLGPKFIGQVKIGVRKICCWHNDMGTRWPATRTPVPTNACTRKSA